MPSSHGRLTGLPLKVPGVGTDVEDMRTLSRPVRVAIVGRLAVAGACAVFVAAIGVGAHSGTPAERITTAPAYGAVSGR